MEPDEQDPQAIHIIIRLPDGTRLERRFTSNDLLQVSTCTCNGSHCVRESPIVEVCLCNTNDLLGYKI